MDTWKLPTIDFGGEEKERELKLAFAAALAYSPESPVIAARKVFGADMAKALFAANNWAYDALVLNEMEKYVVELGAENLLPDKSRYALELLNFARNAGPDYAYQYFKLYNQVMGYEGKGGVHVGDNVTNNVLVIREGESFEDWEKGVYEQQKRLIHDSTQH